MGIENKPECILHIGMHKTGSSSIQVAFSNQASTGEYEYVSLGPSGNNSQVMYSLFSEKPENYHTNIKMGFTKNDIYEFNQCNLEKLTDILKNTHSKLIIISAEDVSELNELELARLRDFISQYCKSIKVIGYVRPFVSYMQSALQQLIKDGARGFSVEDLYPLYRAKFEKFDNVFAKDQVMLFKYDVSTLLNSDVVEDFCHTIGVSVNSKEVARENEALSLEAASLLYVYHNVGAGFGTGLKAFSENNLLIKALSIIGNKKIAFSSCFIERLAEENADDIEWIESRIGVSIKESFLESECYISSTDDLISLSVEYADDLKQLISLKIQEQVPTPNKIADWVHLLRAQLANSATDYTNAKTLIERSATVSVQLHTVLKDIFFILNKANLSECSSGLRSEIMPLLEKGMRLIDEDKIYFNIDLFRDGFLMGWILDRLNPSCKLAIELYCNQTKIGECIADQYRADLVDTISEDGCCAFKMEIDHKMNVSCDQMLIHVKDYNKYFYVNPLSIEGLSDLGK